MEIGKWYRRKNYEFLQIKDIRQKEFDAIVIRDFSEVEQAPYVFDKGFRTKSKEFFENIYTEMTNEEVEILRLRFNTTPFVSI
jgi:hypothetical protein